MEERDRSHRRHPGPWAVLLATVLSASGCGSRLTHEHLTATWQGGSAPVAAVSGGPAGGEAAPTAPAAPAVEGAT
ncbi:MAG: hypothetical protein ACRDHO_07155, partial [Actinomycetota bacterium]